MTEVPGSVQTSRHALEHSPAIPDVKVAVIATEEFVAAVAGQRDRHVLSRELRDQKRRNLRRIGERLVIHRRQLRHVVLGVIRFQVLGDGLRKRGFVVAVLFKTDRERLHRSIAVLLHQRDDERRINPSGKKRSERYVGNHPQPHRVAEQLQQPLHLCLHNFLVDPEYF